MAHIVILGGGIGGIVAANLLRRKLGKEHGITLLDRSRSHLFAPSLLWILAGKRTAESIQRPLARLGRKGIAVVNAPADAIDLQEKRVRTLKGDFPYDYLIIALGADLAPEAVPGLRENGYNLYDPEEVQRLRKTLADFGGGKVLVLVSRVPFKCPAAPYEAAFLIERLLRGRGGPTEVEVCTPEALPMPVAGPEIGNAIRSMLDVRGIAFSPERKVASVGGSQIRFDDGQAAGFDLLAYVPPHAAPKVVRDAGLTDESGWIPVDARTLRTRHERVYAIGDIAAIRLPDGKMLPKAGVFAHRQAEAVASAIATDLGRGSAKGFDGRGMCFLETGDGAAGFASGDFYAQPRRISMRRPSRLWLLAKVLLEKYWFWKWL